MTCEKIPISFNEEDLARIQELVQLMGISSTYGSTPKAVKFGISLALAAIKFPEKVEQDLNDTEMDLFFSSRARFLKMERAKQKAQNIINEAQKV